MHYISKFYFLSFIVFSFISYAESNFPESVAGSDNAILVPQVIMKDSVATIPVSVPKQEEQKKSSYISRLYKFLAPSHIQDRVPLPYDKLPQEVKAVIEKMNFDPSKIYVSKSLGYNAYAMFGTITIGEGLLNSYPNQEIEFVVAHEIAHIQKKHQLKLFSLPFLIVMFENITNKIAKYYSLNNHFSLNTCFDLFKVTNYPWLNSIASNLMAAITGALVTAKLKRFHEKEADLIAARVAGNVSVTAAANSFKADAQAAHFYRPSFFEKMYDYFFDAHPSAQERYHYLQEIVQKQS